MRQRTSQIKTYKVYLDQTSKDGSFHCPNCEARISPDDHSEAKYAIHEIILKDNNLDEVIIYCKRCLSFIHLGGFFEIDKKDQSINVEGSAARDELPFHFVCTA